MKKRKAAFFLICLFIIAFGFAVPCPGNNSKHIILIETMPVPVVLAHSRWFRAQLKEMGYEEGKNLKLTILKPNGDRIKER